MLAQYKKKPKFVERLVPSFFKKPQLSDLYEFRCNVDEKGRLDSPLSLKWDPVFSHLDENKETQGFICSALYYPKVRRIDVLNLEHLIEYQQGFGNSKKISVISYRPKLI